MLIAGLGSLLFESNILLITHYFLAIYNQLQLHITLFIKLLLIYY